MLTPRRTKLSSETPRVGSSGLLESKPPVAALEELFAELDSDQSGNISKSELEQALVKIYGKPLERKQVDAMMKAADTDGDGEISLSEFLSMMAQVDKVGEDKPGKSSVAGLWFAIRSRGPGRLIKASQEMRERRAAEEQKRFAKIEQALADMGVATDPSGSSVMAGSSSQFLSPARPAATPSGGKAQTPSSKGKPRLASRVGKRKGKEAVDLELGGGGAADAAAAADLDERWWLARLCETLSLSCLAMAFLEFLDTYLPVMIAFAVPASFVLGFVEEQLQALTADSNGVAPPPPPAQPDLLRMAETGFYDFAQERPGAYLVLDLGSAFAIGALALFWKDITDWLERRRLRGTYKKLQEEEENDDEEEQPVVSTQVLRMQLDKAINVMEEVRARVLEGELLASHSFSRLRPLPCHRHPPPFLLMSSRVRASLDRGRSNTSWS